MAGDAGTRTELYRSWVQYRYCHNAHYRYLRTPKLFNTTRAHTPDPQAQEPLSQWTEVWPTLYCAAAFQHNAHNLRTPKHARRTPKHGVAIAMDGGMADTACYYTGR